MSTPLLGIVLIAGVLFAVVWMFGLSKRWGMLVPCSAMLLFSAMSIPYSWNDRINPTFWLSIQTRRSDLYLAFGVISLLTAILQFGRFHGLKVSGTQIILGMVMFYAALLRFAHGGPMDGVESVVFTICTYTPLFLVCSMVLRSLDDFQDILHAIVIVNLVWLVMVGIQTAVNPQYITTGNQFRFVGLQSQPQHTGALLPYFVIVSLWLLLNGPNKFKFFYLGLLGVNGLFLLWTGSRTGMGMTLIGLCSVLYTRTGRAILLLPFAGILTYVSLKLMINILGVEFGFSRLASTEDTRGHVWRNLLRIGMENPAFGVGIEDSENSENSWLYGFASYGVGMLALLIALAFAAFVEVLKNIRARFSLPQMYRPHIDLTTGAICMYFAGAMLEGYIMSRVATSIYFFCLFSGAAAFIRSAAHQFRNQEYLEEYNENDEYGEYGEYEDHDLAYDDYSDSQSG